MDENISAPPSIKLNINEESNIDYYPPPDEIENKTKDEQYTLGNNNEEYNNKENNEKEKYEYNEEVNNEKDNNNYNNKEEYEEKGIEEEKEQIQRPLNSNNNNEIDIIRLVFQSIYIVVVYGLAIWELVLQIVYVFTYDIIDAAF